MLLLRWKTDKQHNGLIRSSVTDYLKNNQQLLLKNKESIRDN